MRRGWRAVGRPQAAERRASGAAAATGDKRAHCCIAGEFGCGAACNSETAGAVWRSYRANGGVPDDWIWEGGVLWRPLAAAAVLHGRRAAGSAAPEHSSGRAALRCRAEGSRHLTIVASSLELHPPGRCTTPPPASARRRRSAAAALRRWAAAPVPPLGTPLSSPTHPAPAWEDGGHIWCSKQQFESVSGKAEEARRLVPAAAPETAPVPAP